MFKIIAEPTFPAKVAIPNHSSPAVDVTLTFKHRTRTQLAALFAEIPTSSDADMFMKFVVGWDIGEPFTRENVELLLEHRMGAAVAAFDAYKSALLQEKEKN